MQYQACRPEFKVAPAAAAQSALLAAAEAFGLEELVETTGTSGGPDVQEAARSTRPCASNAGAAEAKENVAWGQPWLGPATPAAHGLQGASRQVVSQRMPAPSSAQGAHFSGFPQPAPLGVFPQQPFACPPMQLQGSKLILQLCPKPWTHLWFTIKCQGKWPAQLRDKILNWEDAKPRDAQVSFPTKKHGDVVQRLLTISTQTGLQVEHLPPWVCAIAGFGREDAAPDLGVRRADAEKQLQQFLQTLPVEQQQIRPVLPYQVEGIAYGLHRGGRVLLGDEMGLGKTLQALLLAAQYKEEWPLLVIAPSSLRFVWRDQAAQWLPHLVGDEGQHVHVLTGGRCKAPQDVRIVVSTYDLLRRHEQYRSRPDGRDFLVVVVDESQNIKEGKTQRTKTVVGLCKSARRVVLLSGTPALNRATELYTQLEALLPHQMPSFTQFAERYCNKEIQRFGKKTIEKWGGARRNAELNHLLTGSVMIRRLKRDVLDQLPPKRRMRVPLDPEKMDQDTLKEVERIMKGHAGTEATDFEQEGQKSGVVNLGQTAQLFSLTAKAKVGAVLDYLENQLLAQNAKFLFFGHHQHMLDSAEQKLRSLGTQYIRIDGTTHHSQRPVLVEQFQEKESVRVALLGITAAGVGITLTAAHLVVFGELYWVPGLILQAEDRAHRLGQRDCVTVQYLVASGTLDDAVFKALERKTLATTAMLDGRQRGLAAQRESLESAAAQASGHRPRQPWRGLAVSPDGTPQAKRLKSEAADESGEH